MVEKYKKDATAEKDRVLIKIRHTRISFLEAIPIIIFSRENNNQKIVQKIINEGTICG